MFGEMLTQIVAILHIVFVNSLQFHPNGGTIQLMNECILNYAQSIHNISDGLVATHIRELTLRSDTSSCATDSDSLSKGERDGGRRVIFGVGSGTTGTRSLHLALQAMGLDGWHFEKAAPWTRNLLDTLGRFTSINKTECRRRLQVYDYAALPATVKHVIDSPADQLLIHFLATFPNAKFILSTRPSLEWAQSRRKHMRKTLAPLQDPCGYHIEDFPDDHVLAQLEDAKVQFARCIVPKHRLLEFSVFTDSDERIRGLVQEIGAFVGQPVAADRKLPGSRLLEIHGNTSFEFDTEEMLRSSAAVHIHPDQMYTASELGVLMRELAYYE
eukprot:gnl/TRDRNA2_/TRDRNA2_82990_c0_seq3.p1 gnl/TRDRNA2_/TRDRNA2_82990_c0~~gnl/TRDRNA2_/TRDRNA2_82990_c0_seq3.p1  ORF type:complete len:328 (+),score=21.28 gnl/TRDRNA2_/TRDRNA2_82990_c0_seq3:114-1097(+)